MNLSVPIPRLIIAFKNYGGHFDPEQKQERLQVLESLMNEPNFWSNENSSNIISEVNSIKHLLDDVSSLKKDLEDNLELVNLLKEEDDDELSQSLEDSIPKFSKRLNDMELLLLLNGPYDTCDCILELHPGAGGTESCDWASMLYRMYTRYCEKHHYKLEEYDYQSGDEAGLKSVAAIIHGDYAYGYLKCEKGVHRLPLLILHRFIIRKISILRLKKVTCVLMSIVRVVKVDRVLIQLIVLSELPIFPLRLL